MLILVCNILFWQRNETVISQISEQLVFVPCQQMHALIELFADEKTHVFEQEGAIIERLIHWSQQICYDEIAVKEEDVPINENFVEYISAIRNPQQITVKERAIQISASREVDLVVPKQSDLVAARRLFNNHSTLKNKT